MARVSRRNRAAVAMAAGLLAGTALTGCGEEEDRGAEQVRSNGSAQSGAAPGDEPADDLREEAGEEPGERNDAAEVVRTAHEKTVRAGSARMTLTVHAAAGGRKQTVTGNGTIDLADGTSDLTIKAGGQRIEQRVVDQNLYQKLPESLRGRVSDGKPWIKVDLREAAGQVGDVGGMQLSDPAQAIDYARALSDDDATRIGTEKVDGVDTTHYRVTVDVEELAGEDTPAGERLRQQLGESLPMDLWLDGQDRIRRQQFELDVRAPGGTASASPGSARDAEVRTVIEFDDFGTPVEVSAPPAGQTADVTDELVRRGEGSSNG